MVRTPAFQADNRGPIPRRATKLSLIMSKNKKIIYLIVIILALYISVGFFISCKAIANKGFIGKWKAISYGGGFGGDYKKLNDSYLVIYNDYLEFIQNGKKSIGHYAKNGSSLRIIDNHPISGDTQYLYPSPFGDERLVMGNPMLSDGYMTYYERQKTVYETFFNPACRLQPYLDNLTLRNQSKNRM